MKKIYFNQEVSFQDFLDIMQVYELKSRKVIAKYVDNINLYLDNYFVKNVYLYEDEIGIKYGCDNSNSISIKFENNKYEISGLNNWDIRDENLALQEQLLKGIRQILPKLYKGKDYQLNQEFTLNNKIFNLSFKANKIFRSYKIYPFKITEFYLYKLIIKSKDTTDTFYLDLATGDFYIKNGDKLVLLSETLKKKIIAQLPPVVLPQFLLDEVLKKVYTFDGINFQENEPFFWETLFKNVQVAYLLDYDEEKCEVQNDNISFLEMLNKSSQDLTFEENAKQIGNSIKEILLSLKQNKIVLENAQKIKILDRIFYAEINEERKVIDPFFNDPEIIVNCDLSKIDFTKADLREMNLAGTNANINLRTLYNKSVKGANLENVLLFQDLDGIEADGANLVGTFVIVMLDKASITNATFGEDAVFMLGNNKLPLDLVLNMGINIATKNKPQILERSKELNI